MKTPVVEPVDRYTENYWNGAITRYLQLALYLQDAPEPKPRMKSFASLHYIIRTGRANGLSSRTIYFMLDPTANPSSSVRGASPPQPDQHTGA